MLSEAFDMLIVSFTIVDNVNVIWWESKNYKIYFACLQFMPIVIGQNSNDQIEFHFMDPNTFMKSLSGKPKLK